MRKFIQLINEASTYHIDDEDSTPTEDAEYEREKRIAAAVRSFCVKEAGLELEGGYAVMVELVNNEISIRPADSEVTLAQLNKFAIMGVVKISGDSSAYGLLITISIPDGFDITAP